MATPKSPALCLQGRGPEYEGRGVVTCRCAAIDVVRSTSRTSAALKHQSVWSYGRRAFDSQLDTA